MMNELRWILIAASIVLLAWIYWQGRRKNYATMADQPARREVDPPQLGEAVIVRDRVTQPRIVTEPTFDDDLPEVRVSPPPLSMDAAMSTSALEKLTITQPLKVAPVAAPAVAPLPTITAQPPAEKPQSTRKILALRVAAAAAPFSGEHLKEWFANHQLRHGKYDIFHRYDDRGDLMFSIASMIEPGSFDREKMTSTQYPGVSMFLQLPSIVDGVEAFDAMFACAQALQRDFAGQLFGERNAPLTPAMVERMRESIADFQHLLSAPQARH